MLFGVSGYLGGEGVRWFEPGDAGTNIPGKQTLDVKPRTRTGAPSFVARSMDFSGWHDTIFDFSDRRKYWDEVHHEYDLWLLRNRLIFDRTIHSGHNFDFNSFNSSGGHSLVAKCKLKREMLETHPERFPLVTRDGKTQRVNRNAQICFTNSDNVRAAIESSVEHFRRQQQSAPARSSDLDDIADVMDQADSDDASVRAAADAANDALLDDVASDYERELVNELGPEPVIDLMILGMGPDGHYASLFPGHDEVKVTDRLTVGVNHSPKMPPLRVSLTAPLIARSRHTWFFAAGAGKAESLAHVFEQPNNPDYPSSYANGVDEFIWFSTEETVTEL